MPGPAQNIIIIGTGVSGLSLAQGLRKANIPFRVFERDPSFNGRAQGYRIRIDGLGNKALQETLPPDLFAKVKSTSAPFLAGGVRLDALSGEPLVGGGGPPPRGSEEAEPLSADRTVLRRLLMRGLEEHVTFGKRFVSYETTESGVIVRFSDGTEVEGSLLVGADGARSSVRKQFLPNLAPVDSEGRLIYGKTLFTPELEETLDKRVLGGLSMLRDATRAGPLSAVLEPMRFDVGEGVSRQELGLPEDYLYWVLCCRSDVLEDTGLLGMFPEEATALSLKLTSNWHPSLRALLTLQDTTQTSGLPLSTMRPDIPDWEPSNRVTLIGDAIHVMSPTAGIGANTALRDAALLYKTLVDGKDIGSYEATMRKYAGEAVGMSRMGGKNLFGMKPFEELKAVT